MCNVAYQKSVRKWSAFFFFVFNDTATTEIYTLSLHDALPIWHLCARLYRRMGASSRRPKRHRKAAGPSRQLDRADRTQSWCPRTRPERAEGFRMDMPVMLQGDSPVRLFQGAIAGAALTMIIGFGWAGWTLGGTAAKMADESSRTAV